MALGWQKLLPFAIANLVFYAVIHKSVRLAEAPSAGESILSYAPESKSAAEYRALADEVINSQNPPEQVEVSTEQTDDGITSIGEIIDGKV